MCSSCPPYLISPDMWLEDRVVAMDDAAGRGTTVAETSTLLTSKSDRKITVLRERVPKLT